MAYIFLDESGDLGFKKKSSKWFVFTIAMTQNARSLERVTKKIWRPLKKRHKQLGELHAYHADNVTRKRMLSELAKIENLKVSCVILNKQKVYIDLQNQKNYLYNYTANILLDRLYTKEILKPKEAINLFADRKDTKNHLRENFINYLTTSMKKRRDGGFSVVLHSSHENKSLQAVDFISWSIFRKYEKGDYEFYEIIKNKIVDERLLFP
ncbi:MAG: DUF3800 domain-containing protein [Candidatus Pacebacteria bacterium]|nr:DUF3800 domain-containing protein [Candidatus Paceibacterota bacterium]NUQ57405.1 DUF3800 domain-containing protein [Candidatus Paceibacter sp.]